MTSPVVVTLVPLTLENYQQVVQLCVSPEQERFVGTPADAVADAYFHPTYVMRAIFSSTEAAIVGFLMYELNSAKTLPPGGIALHRFLVHCTHQGKGYGLAAMEELKRALRRQLLLPLHLELRTKAANLNGIRFYRRAGFQVDPLPKDPAWERGVMMLV